MCFSDDGAVENVAGQTRVGRESKWPSPLCCVSFVAGVGASVCRTDAGALRGSPASLSVTSTTAVGQPDLSDLPLRSTSEDAEAKMEDEEDRSEEGRHTVQVETGGGAAKEKELDGRGVPRREERKKQREMVYRGPSCHKVEEDGEMSCTASGASLGVDTVKEPDMVVSLKVAEKAALYFSGLIELEVTEEEEAEREALGLNDDITALLRSDTPDPARDEEGIEGQTSPCSSILVERPCQPRTSGEDGQQPPQREERRASPAAGKASPADVPRDSGGFSLRKKQKPRGGGGEYTIDRTNFFTYESLLEVWRKKKKKTEEWSGGAPISDLGPRAEDLGGKDEKPVCKLAAFRPRAHSLSLPLCEEGGGVGHFQMGESCTGARLACLEMLRSSVTCDRVYALWLFIQHP